MRTIAAIIKVFGFSFDIGTSSKDYS
jgi:hypothetical protein